ncbi:RNA-directed DNA polymerase, eukaryota, reverse transcriptase zinc-binding domain protein, partial [Tanacetum coccineum]
MLYYFQNFLGSEDEGIPIEDLDGLFIKKLDPQCAANMIRPVLNDEIKLAMFSIEDDKAAGSDGFSSRFFKAAWKVVGDVCAAVKEFFSSCKLLGEFNANLISLVLKLKTPLKITDYRPIACGNVVYKCISKRRAFKVDIEKAYDMVNWEFLKTALLRFGFHASMIKWIMGDLMSPYLFTIVMEVFNLMVQRQIRLDNRFKYHWGCSRIRLTHLCFADDLLMLCHGDHISACILRRAIDEFSMTSGLYPNMFKSTVFYGNVPDTIKDEIQLAMPFREGVLPARYLGISLTVKTLSIADCRVLIEKNFVWSKNDAAKGIASVAWKEVCRPKDEGGLGLKSLKVMNHALMVKHLWNIASKKDSLWVKWLNVYGILLAVDAAKGLVESVEIWYKSLGKSMMLSVEYVWRPSLCDHCKTFGHFSKFCSKAQASVDKENRGEVKVKSNMSAGNVNNDQDGWQNVDYRRGNRVFGNSFQQRSFNGYNGRGNMGYRGRDGYSNKGSNSFVNNEVKENLSKYVSVKNKEKVVNVDECLVTDEVMKTMPSTGADKLSKEDAVNNGLGNRGSNGKSNGVNGKESTGMDDISMTNRFDVLIKENEEEVLDTWEDVRIQVISACNSGVPIADEVTSC